LIFNQTRNKFNFFEKIAIKINWFGVNLFSFLTKEIPTMFTNSGMSSSSSSQKRTSVKRNTDRPRTILTKYIASSRRKITRNFVPQDQKIVYRGQVLPNFSSIGVQFQSQQQQSNATDVAHVGDVFFGGHWIKQHQLCCKGKDFLAHLDASIAFLQNLEDLVHYQESFVGDTFDQLYAGVPMEKEDLNSLSVDADTDEKKNTHSSTILEISRKKTIANNDDKHGDDDGDDKIRIENIKLSKTNAARMQTQKSNFPTTNISHSCDAIRVASNSTGANEMDKKGGSSKECKEFNDESEDKIKYDAKEEHGNRDNEAVGKIPTISSEIPESGGGRRKYKKKSREVEEEDLNREQENGESRKYKKQKTSGAKGNGAEGGGGGAEDESKSSQRKKETNFREEKKAHLLLVRDFTRRNKQCENMIRSMRQWYSVSLRDALDNYRTRLVYSAVKQARYDPNFAVDMPLITSPFQLNMARINDRKAASPSASNASSAPQHPPQPSQSVDASNNATQNSFVANNSSSLTNTKGSNNTSNATISTTSTTSAMPKRGRKRAITDCTVDFDPPNSLSTQPTATSIGKIYSIQTSSSSSTVKPQIQSTTSNTSTETRFSSETDNSNSSNRHVRESHAPSKRGRKKKVVL
jgi:hypothetical protein